MPSPDAAAADAGEDGGVVRIPETLSPRETEVLRLLVLGHTNREVAELLYISVRTAETHRANILRKVGVRSRAELVRHAGLLRAVNGVPLVD